MILSECYSPDLPLTWSTDMESTLLGPPDLAWWSGFLHLVYVLWLNCAFNFRTSNIIGCFRNVMTQFVFMKHKFQNQTTMHTPITTILLTTVGTFHGLNCFGHVIYALLTSVYQNIEELLKNWCFIFFFFFFFFFLNADSFNLRKPMCFCILNTQFSCFNNDKHKHTLPILQRGTQFLLFLND